MEEGAEELGGAGVGGWGRRGGGGGWWRREEEEGGGERRGSGRHQSNIKEAHQKTD